MRRALWIIGIFWVYSWGVICLEVFRWHHLTWRLALNPPPHPPGVPPPHPGMFLLSARALSLAAPLAFLVLLLAKSRRSPRRPSGAARTQR